MEAVGGGGGVPVSNNCFFTTKQQDHFWNFILMTRCKLYACGAGKKVKKLMIYIAVLCNPQSTAEPLYNTPLFIGPYAAANITVLLAWRLSQGTILYCLVNRGTLGVNNLPRVVARIMPQSSRTRDLLITSPTPYRYTTKSPKKTWKTCLLLLRGLKNSHYKIFNCKKRRWRSRRRGRRCSIYRHRFTTYFSAG